MIAPNAEAVATEFTKVLKGWLTPAEWKEMVKTNTTPEYQHGACASHNYCDANEAMMAAFDEFKVPYPADEHPDSFTLWNEAWELARKSWN